MNNECSIVKDLLPLYAENMTSKDTAEFVKTHLEGCESCRNEYTRIKEPPAARAETTAEAAPLKAVKKKLTKKRILIAVCAALATLIVGFAAFLFFDSHPVSHAIYFDWTGSDIYPNDVIAAAGDALVKDFESLHGCKLYSFTYAGDEISKENLAYINEFGHYDECIVFESVFRSPLFGGGGWNAHEIYTWTWYLGRVYGGEWEVVQRGYA
ncbi:MAG: zf-HC2 domain-containing protein [Clostridia bacterium]|nr:zf-HC2 domain-containing protein [Clostridia bacterium]MBQ9505564.1 zf-HC2 domain-containing protein [Clostridia bacterium]